MTTSHNVRALELKAAAVDLAGLATALGIAADIFDALKARGLDDLPDDAPAPITVGELFHLVGVQGMLSRQAMAYDQLMDQHIPDALPETPAGSLIA